MQRIPVESSDIIAVGYDPKTALLEIEFHGGRTYQYRNVPPETHEQLMRADSHGSFFNTFINGRYRFDRVDGGDHRDLPKTLAFVTGASRKVRTLEAALEPYSITVEQLDLGVDEIQSEDAATAATKKSKEAYRMVQRPVVTADTFWNILALRGFPGAYMHDVANWLRAEDFLRLMQDKTDRTVVRTDTLAYYDGKRTKIFSRTYNATLVEAPRGEGLSIDRVIIMEGQTQTIAEMHQTQTIASTGIADSIWQDFAKWFHMQRRLGKA